MKSKSQHFSKFAEGVTRSQSQSRRNITHTTTPEPSQRLQLPHGITATAYKSKHIRRRSVRDVRRLSQLIKLTEKIDEKKQDQNLLKIATELTVEQKNSLDAFDQLGNYVDWLNELVHDTDFNPNPAPVEKPDPTKNKFYKIKRYDSEDSLKLKHRRRSKKASLGRVNKESPQKESQITMQSNMSKISNLSMASKNGPNILKRKRKKKTGKQNVQNLVKMTKLKAVLRKKQENLALKGKEVLSVMKKSNNLSNEFNNAMYTLHNAHDKKRVELALELGKNGNWANVGEIKRKLSELDKTHTQKKLIKEAIKINDFNKENYRRNSRIADMTPRYGSSGRSGRIKKSFRIRDDDAGRLEDIDPYKMLMSQTFSHDMRHQDVEVDDLSLSKLKIYRSRVGTREGFRTNRRVQKWGKLHN